VRRTPHGLRLAAGGLAAIGLGFGLRGHVASTSSAFSASASSSGNVFAAAPDFEAPTAGSTFVAKAAGGAGGAIKPGATYYVYANVTDGGNPASGTSIVTSDVSAVTAGATAVPLAAGSYTVNGASYGYRSAALAAGALADGSYAYTLTLTDAAANARIQSGFSAAIDATAPAASDVQPLNKAGGTVGRAETGDTIVYTFSEPMDPSTILAGWTGALRNVVVRLNNVGGGDEIVIYDATNTTQLSLGILDLGSRRYVRRSRTFGATGTSSTMVMSGNTVTVTLGTPSGTTLTETAARAASWTPSAAATDVAGNAMSDTGASETGTADPNL
jgi:hypothetical protein